MPVRLKALLHTSGPALCPELGFGPERLATERINLGDDFEALYQQEPVGAQGGPFKRDYWQPFDTLPPAAQAIITVDSAFKAKSDNDASVAALWIKGNDDHAYIWDLWYDRVEQMGLLYGIHQFYQRHRALNPRVKIEDKGSGQGAIQTLSRKWAYYDEATGVTEVLPAIPCEPWRWPAALGDPDSRRETGPLEHVKTVLPYVAARMVHVRADAPWLPDWITEHERLPRGAHDDRATTTIMALLDFYGGAGLTVALPKGTGNSRFTDTDGPRTAPKTPLQKMLADKGRLEELRQLAGWVKSGVMRRGDLPESTFETLMGLGLIGAGDIKE